MKIDIITLFPKMFESTFSESIIKKAQEKGILKINIHDLRSFTKDRHRTVDDRPYGGGTGMVLKVEPIYKAIKHLTRKTKNPKKRKIILLSPQGETFSQRKAKELAKKEWLIFICGHYEGVDQRVMSFIDEEISIGNYVLTGGELPAMVLVDSTVRLIPGVVKKEESIREESFSTNLLDYPQYTRPRTFSGKKVPSVLLSGNHEKIRSWRAKKSIRNTFLKRPELLKNG